MSILKVKFEKVDGHKHWMAMIKNRVNNSIHWCAMHWWDDEDCTKKCSSCKATYYLNKKRLVVIKLTII